MKDVILQTVVRIFFPFIIMYGFYVMLYGHIGPGGGFAGGVIIGGGMVLYGLTFGVKDGRRLLPHELAIILESLGGLWYIIVGLVGFVITGYFLANSLTGVSMGVPGRLVSAGLIPLLNVAIGIKVAATVVSLYYDFVEEYENGSN